MNGDFHVSVVAWSGRLSELAARRELETKLLPAPVPPPKPSPPSHRWVWLLLILLAFAGWRWRDAIYATVAALVN